MAHGASDIEMCINLTKPFYIGMSDNWFSKEHVGDSDDIDIIRFMVWQNLYGALQAYTA